MIKWFIFISYFVFFVSCFGPSQSYPTSQQIAFVSSRDGNFEIYVINVDGQGLQRITNHDERDDYPTWHPNGQQLAIVSEREGSHDLYLVNVDGKN